MLTKKRKTGKSPWMEDTLMKQASFERDFKETPKTQMIYGILCGHRMGSNLLSEALYESGVAGDPMEFFNIRWLKKYHEITNHKNIGFDNFVSDIKSRRTSSNGVFGFNIKNDQFSAYINNNPQSASNIKKFVASADKHIFLYRKDKLGQAISAYIGHMADTFRIPATANKADIDAIVQDIPFNPAKISERLTNAIRQEQAWLNFIKNNKLKFLEFSYEELDEQYEIVLEKVFQYLEIPESHRTIPQRPTLKIRSKKNEEFREKFLNFVDGKNSIMDIYNPFV